MAVLATAISAAAFAFAGVAPAYANTSQHVGYIYDFGTGSNDTAGPGSGSSIWVNALTGSAPNGSYTTADASKTVTITDVPVSTIDSSGESAISSFDTVIVYEVCDIGSHAATVAALNTFLTNGGKVIIYDADRCYNGGVGAADYSAFLFPFTTSSPGPDGASGSYTTVVPSTLTTGLSVGPQPGDSVGDANIFTSFSGSWCASITATNVLGANGFVEATARTPSGGLAIYEGEDNAFTYGPTTHLRLVFDDILEQPWAPDGLSCAIPASGISLAPATQTLSVGATATLTAKVVDTGGQPISGVAVAFKVNSGPNAGKTGNGTTDGSGNVTFSYPGTTLGTDAVSASFVDTSGSTHTSNTANVVWNGASSSVSKASGTANGVTLPFIEGAASTQTVATFTSGNASAKTSDFTATIAWGDGSTSAGTIATATSGFQVTGTHTYAEEGVDKATVTIKGLAGAPASAVSDVKVSDARLSAKGLGTLTTASGRFSGKLATFTDADPKGALSDYAVSINWGDGTKSTGKASGDFSATGTHAYGKRGRYTVKIKITDKGGQSTTARTTIVVGAQVSLTGVGMACVRGAMTATVTGRGISSVAFSLDGRRITMVVHRGTRYSAVISVPPGKHRLTAKVTFRHGSRTLRRTVTGCAPVPQFTG